MIIVYNIFLVCRSFLLWAETDEHSLSFRDKGIVTYSFAPECYYVRGNRVKIFSSIETKTIARNPHSVYLVYQPIQFFDLCRNWLGGRIGPPETSRLDPGSLSTLERRPNAAQATKSFDLADLPCPPSAIAAEYDSTVSYTPIYPRDNLTGYEYAPDGVRVPFSNYMVTIENRGSPDRITIPSFSNNTCEMTAIRDPPVYGVRVGEITGPKDGGGPIP